MDHQYSPSSQQVDARFVKEQNEELRAVNAQITGDLLKTQSKLKTLERESTSLKTKIKEMENKGFGPNRELPNNILNDLYSKHTHIRSEIEKLRTSCDMMKSFVTVLQGTRTEMISNCIELLQKHQLGDSNNSLSHQSFDTPITRNKIRKLENENKTLNTQKTQLVQEVNNLMRVKDQIWDQHETVANELNQAIHEKQDYENEISELKHRLVGKETQIMDMTQEKLQLSRQTASMLKQLPKNSSQNEQIDSDLSNTLDKIKDTLDEHQTILDDLDGERSQNDKLRLELRELKSAYQVLERESDEHQLENAKLKEKLHSLTETSTNATEKANSLKFQTETKAMEIKLKEQQLEDYKKNFKHERSHRDEIHKTYLASERQLQAKNKRLQQQLADSKQKTKSFEEEIKQLKETLNSTQSDQISGYALRQEKQNIEDELEHQIDATMKFQQLNHALEQQMANMKEELSRKEAELKDMKLLYNQSNPRTSPSSPIEGSSSRMSQRIMELNNENMRLTDELHEVRMKMTKVDDSMQDKNREIENLNKVHKARLNDQTDILQKHLQEKDETFKRLNELMDKKTDRINQLQRELEEASQYKLLNDRLKKDINDKTDLIRDLETNLDKLFSDLRKEQDTARSANDQLNIYELTHESKEYKIQDLEKREAALLRELNDTKEKFQSLASGHENLERSLNEKSDQISIQKEKLSDIHELTDRLMKMKYENAALKEELEVNKLHIRSMQDSKGLAIESELSALRSSQVDELLEKDAQVQEFKKRLRQNDIYIDELENTMKLQQDEIQELKKHLTSADNSLSNAIDSKDELVKQLKNTVNDQATKLRTLESQMGKIEISKSDAVNAESSRYLSEIRDKDRELSRLTTLTIAQEQRINMLVNQLSESKELSIVKDDEFDKFIGMYTKEKNSNSNTKRQYDNERSVTETLSKKLLAREKKIVELEKQNDEANALRVKALQDLEEVELSFRQRIKEIRLEEQKQQEELHNKVQNYSKQMDELAHALRQKDNELSEKEMELLEAQSRVNPLLDEKDALEREIELLQAKLLESEGELRNNRSLNTLQMDKINQTQSSQQREIERLKQSEIHYKKTLQAKTIEIEDNESHIQRLQKELADKELEIAQLEQGQEQLERDVENHRLASLDTTQAMEDLKNTQRRQDEDYENHISALKSEKKQNADLRAKIDALTMDLARTQTQLEHRDEQIQSLETHIDEDSSKTLTVLKQKNQKLAEMKKELTQIKVETNKLRGTIEQLNHQVALLRETESQLTEQLNSKCEEVNYHRSVANEEKEKFMDLQQQFKAQRDAYDDLQHTVALLESRQGKLDQKEIEIQELQKAISEKDSVIRLKDREISQLKSAEDQTHMETKERAKILSGLRDQIQALNHTIYEKDQDAAASRIQYIELRDKNNSLETQISELKTNVDVMEDKYAKAESSIANYKEQVMQLNEQLESVESDKEQLKSQIKMWENKFNMKENELTDQEILIRNLRDSLKSKEVELVKKQHLIDSLEQQEEINMNHKDAVSKLRKVEDKFVSLQLEHNNLKRIHNKTIERKERLETQVVDMTSELTVAEEEKKKILKQLKQSKLQYEQLKADVELLKQEKEGLNQLLLNRNNIINELEQLRKKLEAEVRDKQKLVDEKDTQIKDLRQQLLDQEDTISRMKREKTLSDKAFEDLNKEKSQLEDKLDDEKRALQSQTKELQRLNDSIEEHKNTQTMLEKKLDLQQKRLKEVQRDRDDIENHNNELQRTIEKKDREIESIKKELNLNDTTLREEIATIKRDHERALNQEEQNKQFLREEHEAEKVQLKKAHDQRMELERNRHEEAIARLENNHQKALKELEAKILKEKEVHQEVVTKQKNKTEQEKVKAVKQADNYEDRISTIQQQHKEELEREQKRYQGIIDELNQRIKEDEEVHDTKIKDIIKLKDEECSTQLEEKEHEHEQERQVLHSQLKDEEEASKVKETEHKIAIETLQQQSKKSLDLSEEEHANAIEELKDLHAKEIKKLGKQIKALQTQIEDANADAQEQIKNIQRQHEKHLAGKDEAHEADLEEEARKYSSIERKLTNSRKQLEEQVDINEDLRAKLLEANKTLSKIKSDRDALMEDLEAADKSNEISKLKDQIRRQDAQFEERLNELDAEIDVLNGKLTKANAALVQKEEERAISEAKRHDAVKARNAISKTLEQKEEELVDMSNELQERATEVHQLENQYNAVLDRLNAVNAKYETRVKQLLAEIEALRSNNDNNEKLQELKDQYEKENQQLSKKIDKLNKDMEDAEIEITKLKNENKTLGVNSVVIQQVTDTTTRISRLKNSNDVLKMRLDDMNNTMEKYQKHITEFSKYKQYSKHQLAEKQQLIDEIKNVAEDISSATSDKDRIRQIRAKINNGPSATVPLSDLKTPSIHSDNGSVTSNGRQRNHRRSVRGNAPKFF